MLELLQPFLVPVLGALGAGLALLLTQIFHRLSKYIQAKVENAALEGVLLRLNDTTATLVLELENTLIKELKRGLADGKLDQKDIDLVKHIALDRLKQLIGKEGLDRLLHVLGLKNADTLLQSKIESAVTALKLGKQ